MATAAAKKQTAIKVADRIAGTLGSAIDKAFELREKKREAEKVVKLIEAEIEANNEILFQRLDAQELKKGEGKLASVSISNTTVANVEDWPAFWAWIAKNKHFHMVQKRASDPAVREIWESGKTVPGVTPFTKRTLNLRSLTPNA